MAGTIFTNAVRFSVVASFFVLSACKSEEEKMNDAVGVLFSGIVDENDLYAKAVNSGDGSAAAESILRMEELMLSFNDEYLDGQWCSRSDRLVCYSHFIRGDSSQAMRTFIDFYAGIERRTNFVETEYPQELANARPSQPAVINRPNASEIDGNALLPPPSGN